MKLYDGIYDAIIDPVAKTSSNTWLGPVLAALVVIIAAVLILVLRKRRKKNEKR